MTQPPDDPAYDPAYEPTFQPTFQPMHPTLPPPPGPPGPATVTIDWRRLVVGNWTGASIVAVVVLLTAGVLGLAVALLVKPPDLGISHTLDLATAIATSTFGADFGVSGEIDDVEFSGGLAAFPLTLTVVVLVVAAVSFRRMVRRYPTPGAAFGDAARVALMVGVGLMAVAIAFRGDNDELGRGWGAELSADAIGGDVDYGPGVAGSLLLGFLVTFVTLALVVVATGDGWSARAQRVRDRVVTVLYGYALVAVLLPLVGLIGFLLLGFGEESLNDAEDETNLRELLTVVTVLLANGGVLVLGLGSGARLGGTYSAEGGGESEEDQEHQRLWGTITDDEPGLWASPVILLLVLAVSAFVVVRRSRAREHVFGNLMAWALGLVVVVPLLVRLANAHVHGDASQSGFGGGIDYEFSAAGGVHGADATFFILVIAVVVATVAAVLTGTFDLGPVRQRLASLQAAPTPGAAMQPPAQQPYSQPSMHQPPTQHGLPTRPPPSGPPSGPPPSGPPPPGPPPG